MAHQYGHCNPRSSVKWHQDFSLFYLEDWPARRSICAHLFAINQKYTHAPDSEPFCCEVYASSLSADTVQSLQVVSIHVSFESMNNDLSWVK